MASQEAREHHFVPQFLLRPWAVEGLLRGYWWDAQRGTVVCKRKGPRAFCRQPDLLTLRRHGLGRDALERLFFAEIDNRGASARDRLLVRGPTALTPGQRSDFARLLLSLEARRPLIVAKLRAGSDDLAQALDTDPEILATMTHEALTETPSSYYERVTGKLLEDRALSGIEKLVDNPNVGGKLINGYWHIVRLGSFDASFVLSDRPLIRLRAYDHPGAVWVLPLTPKAAFVSVNHPAMLDRIKQLTTGRFAKKANVSSAGQTERFLFCVDTSHADWIGKYLST